MIGTDPAEDSEDGLDQEGRFDQATVHEMGQIVEMSDVVAFELELNAMAFTQRPSARVRCRRRCSGK